MFGGSERLIAGAQHEAVPPALVVYLCPLHHWLLGRGGAYGGRLCEQTVSRLAGF